MNMKCLSKKSIRKTFSLLLCLLLMISIVAGCGQTANNPQPTEKPTQTATQAPSQTPVVEEAMKLSVMLPLYVAEAPAVDTLVQKEIEKKTNTELTISWVPNSTYNDKVNLVMASSELPDVLSILDVKNVNFVNAVRGEAFWEVGQYLNDYEHLKDASPVVLNNISIDGKVYGIYRGRNLVRQALLFRQDWLDNLGLKAPKTTDDLYNVLKAFAKNDPDKNNKDDTIGLSLYGGNIKSILSMGGFNPITVWFGAGSNYIIEDGKFQTVYNTEEFMETLRFFRKLYEEDLINKDFLLVNGVQAMDLVKQGKAGAVINTAGNAYTIKKDGVKLNPDFDMNAIMRIESPTKGPRTIAAIGHNGIMAINKKGVPEEKFKRILTFFDKMESQEMQYLVSHGIEGTHYKLEGGVLTTLIDDAIKQRDVSAYIQLKPQFIDRVDLKYPDPLQDIEKRLNLENADIAVGDPSMPFISETDIEKKPALDKIIMDASLKFILGDVGEEEVIKAQQSWLEQGGQQVLDEYTAEYQKTLK